MPAEHATTTGTAHQVVRDRPPRHRRKVPTEPLEGFVARRGGLEQAGLRALDPTAQLRLSRAYYRAVAAGQVTLWAADQLAVELLGVHPIEVWGQDWIAAAQE